ncbi:hypothetical protein HPP92_023125 [Vanilla planifolia]|uniref:Uncharacterized protein n=1 Tax=Vanilla planifolia TaxID=51239 RepID=A0A835UFR9_VANPL|nr:hypothetical protein HPP92_023125 [Vanilla planifolia]
MVAEQQTVRMVGKSRGWRNQEDGRDMIVVVVVVKPSSSRCTRSFRPCLASKFALCGRLHINRHLPANVLKREFTLP